MFWSLFYGVGVAYSYKWMLDWPGVCHLVLCFLGFIVCGLGCVFWCLKVSRCFTWNTTFLQQPICFTWNVVFALRRPKDVNVFHVKRRVGWLSCWWWFLRTLSLVVVEEVVFHVKHWFWILFSCWEMRFSVSRHWHAWLLFRSKEKQDRWRILSGLSSVGMNGFFQRLNKLRCVTAFWWFACCGSFCVGFTVRFLYCGWLCVFGDVSRETLLPHIFMASYGDG